MKSHTHLDVGPSTSKNFLRAWQAWLANPQRPHMLHFVAVCEDGYSNAHVGPELKELAGQLDTQLWGLLPGFHRFSFENGRVLFTLCIGNIQAQLRQHRFAADSVFLDNISSPWIDSIYTVKSIARLCKPGSVFKAASGNAELSVALTQCGFKTSDKKGLQALYNPGWSLKNSIDTTEPTSCIVIGAGLAGAAVASSLARRGWAVRVLDAAGQPAGGASGLPAGTLVAQTSPDDNLAARLSRAGVRMTLQQARACLVHGTNWGHTGVLQRLPEGQTPRLPPAWAARQLQAASDWCYPASQRSLRVAGLPVGSHALWHAQAGWVKPAALVKAWLAEPGITWLGGVQAAGLEATQHGWQVRDTSKNIAAHSDFVVLCAGFNSQALVNSTAFGKLNTLQAIKGQVTFGLLGSAALPPFAVNGRGNLIPGISTPDGPLWLMGASYERDVGTPGVTQAEHANNLTRLQGLLPAAAAALADQFGPARAQGWSGIRCATRNRLPLLAPVPQAKGVWLCTGMGSRGLTYAALCAEALAAHLHGEPLPIERQLAQAMGLGLPT